MTETGSSDPSLRAGAVLEVDLGAVVANWRTCAARHPSGPVAGVVKADAYGLGAAAVAPALAAAGCRHFFVATLEEALALRPLVPGAMPPDGMVAVLGGPLPGTEAEYLAHDIDTGAGSLAEIDAWSAAARRAGRRCRRCCMSIPAWRGSASTRRRWRRCATIRGGWTGSTLRYVMTHLVSAELRRAIR